MKPDKIFCRCSHASTDARTPKQDKIPSPLST